MERGLPTFIARFHNVYGPKRHLVRRPGKGPRRPVPQGDRGQGQAPRHARIWGDGTPTQFMYVDDCTLGIDKITHCPELVATPINLGSAELVSVNQLVTWSRRLRA